METASVSDGRVFDDVARGIARFCLSNFEIDVDATGTRIRENAASDHAIMSVGTEPNGVSARAGDAKIRQANACLLDTSPDSACRLYPLIVSFASSSQE